jgi:RimJ/RimL family protein N-acetyltransferase
MIRRLSPADWLAFRDIRLDMLRTDPDAFGAALADWDTRPEAMIRDWLTHMHGFGAVEGNRITACAAFSRARQPRTQHRAEVAAVYTRPANRGQGLLRAVFGRMADEARKIGIAQFELQVASHNNGAILAYERIGFARTGVLPRAVNDGGRYTDDILMVWPLDRG